MSSGHPPPFLLRPPWATTVWKPDPVISRSRCCRRVASQVLTTLYHIGSFTQFASTCCRCHLATALLINICYCSHFRRPCVSYALRLCRWCSLSLLLLRYALLTASWFPSCCATANSCPAVRYFFHVIQFLHRAATTGQLFASMLRDFKPPSCMLPPPRERSDVLGIRSRKLTKLVSTVLLTTYYA